MEQGIGARVRRKEDPRLLAGQGCYSDDFNLPGQAHAYLRRSPHGHARILGIDSAKALASPGVLLVLTGADLLADGLGPILHNPIPAHPSDPPFTNVDGSEIFVGLHYALPADKVRFVGEGVAFVIAETLEQARDAAELLTVDYEVLEAVTDTTAATCPDAPRVYEETPGNVCVDARFGDAAATDTAFAGAAHTVAMTFDVGRVTGVPLEPRAAIGDHDAETGRSTLYAGSGNVVRQKKEIAGVFGEPEDNIRVVAREVGGNFGTRNAIYPEFPLVVWAARRAGRPVKWTCDRSEAFLSDYQGRDLVVEAELALDADGKFLALRSTNTSNLGAHSISLVPLSKGIAIFTGTYDIPAAHVVARAVFSNTPSTNPYRSAGRPEVNFVIERLVEAAALKMDLDPLEIRRRNLIPPAAMPYQNPLGMTYDSGHFAENMDKVLALADWDGFAARKAESTARGLHRGLGLASYVETSTGIPRERTEITIRPDDQVDVVIGTLSSGQGHDTSFAQVVTELLGVPFESVQMITGDTDIVEFGGGTHSGRSMRLAGIVIGHAADEIIDKGRRMAAELLEAAEADLEFTEGRFHISGTDRSVTLFELARAADKGRLSDDLNGPLGAVADKVSRTPAFPNGCHVCEVEVDVATGGIDLVRYAAIDDVGRAINPMIVDGQTHGGIVQGLGEAMGEACIHEEGSGQLLSGSFLDYRLPRADDVPAFRVAINEVPTPTNPLGVKAGGEGGTTPALAVYVNAVVDALREFGVRHIELPLTPEKVWRAIRDGTG